MARQERRKSKKYTGVYYRESEVRRYRGRPDKCYWIAFPDLRKKLKWIRIGWASHGISEAYAHNKRIEYLHKQNLGEDPSGKRRFTAEDAFEEYFSWAESESKIIGPERNRWKRHIKPRFGEFPLEAITPQDLVRFKADLLKDLSPGSVKHIFSLMRRAINKAIRLGLWSGVNPISLQSEFELPKVRNQAERFFTPEEAKLILDNLLIRSQQLHDMSLLSLKTGMRATELFNLRLQDVDFENGIIWIQAKGGEREKCFADRTVLEMLSNYDRKPSEYVFQSRKGERLKEISDSFGRAIDHLKLNEGVTDKRQMVWFHTWRHTFASWLAQSGEFTLHEIKEYMRHERIETTERYAHLIPDRRRRKLSVIGEKLASVPDRHQKS